MKDSLLLAPLLGVTDASYRNAFVKNFSGFDRAVAPFIKTLEGGRVKASKLADLSPKFNRKLDVQAQIISNNSSDFIDVAKILFDIGYTQINLNLGCPVPMAAGRGRGAGLLPHKDFLKKFLETILEKIPNQLSIKTRIGHTQDDELYHLCEMLNDLPIQEVIIHPRTAKALYSGSVNLEAFAQVMATLKHNVVYSGDIKCLADFAMLKERFPQLKSWMIGRGAIIDPFLPAKIKNMKIDFAREAIQRFYEDLRQGYEELGHTKFQVLQKLKAIWFYQSNMKLIDPKVVKSLRKEKCIENFVHYIPSVQEAILSR